MMLIGSTVLSTVGFGIGMSTTPILLLVIEPQTVVVMLNTVAVLLYVLVLLRTRQHLPAKEMTGVSVAGLLGVPLGVIALSSASATVLRVSITALILVLAAVATLNVRWALPRPRMIGPMLGFVVGALLTTTGIGGPLMVLFLLAKDWPRDAVRASLSFYFLFVGIAGVIGYGAAGLFTSERVSLILVVAGPVVLGFALSTIIVPRMNERLFRHAAVSVIVVTSIMVLGREAMRL